jgi:mannose-1-phosphate guanylyltransferase
MPIIKSSKEPNAVNAAVLQIIKFEEELFTDIIGADWRLYQSRLVATMVFNLHIQIPDMDIINIMRQKERTKFFHLYVKTSLRTRMEMAKNLLRVGFSWNAGIFMWSLKSIHSAFKEFYLKLINVCSLEKKIQYPREKELSKDLTNIKNITLLRNHGKSANFTFLRDFG